MRSVRGLSGADRISAPVIATTLGTFWLVLLGGIAVATQQTIDLVIKAHAFSLLALGLLLTIRWSWRASGCAPSDRAQLRLRLPYLGALAAATIIPCAVVAVTAAVVRSGDRWTYLGLIRNHLDTDRLATVNPFLRGAPVDWRQAFDGWGVALAALSRIARIDPVDLYCIYLPPILALLALLAFFAFARELFSDARIAVAAVVIQAIYFISDSTLNQGKGFVFLARIIEDKTLAAYLVFPVAMLLAVRYHRTARTSLLGPYCIIVIASAFLHPLAPVFCGLGLWGFALVRITVERNWPTLTRTLLLTLPIVVALVIPSIQKSSLDRFSLTPDSLNPQMIAAALQLHHNTLWILDLERDIYMGNPFMLQHPVVVLSLVLLPLLFPLLRSSTAAQFLCGNMLLLLLLVFTPPGAILTGHLITPWMLWRLTWILPVSLVVAFAGSRLITYIHKRYAKLHRAKVAIAIAALLAVVLPLAVNVAQRSLDSLAYLHWWHSRRVDPSLRSALASLAQHTNRGTVIMTPRSSAHLLPALAGGVFPIAFRDLTENPPDAYQDMEAFFSSASMDHELLDILRKYDTQTIFIPSSAPLAFQMRNLPSAFKRYELTRKFDLYLALAGARNHPIIVANTLLRQGDLAAAQAIYRDSLDDDEMELLARIGLARVYRAQTHYDKALTEWRNVARTASVGGDLWPETQLLDTLLEQAKQDATDAIYSEFVQEFTDALHADPTSPELHRALLSILPSLPPRHRDELFGSALETYELLRSTNPQKISLYWRIADLYELAPNQQAQRALYQAIVAQWPLAARAHLQLGRIYADQGQDGKAICHLRWAVRGNPRLDQAHFLLSRSLIRAGKIRQARRQLTWAMRLFPAAKWPRRELTRLSSQSK